MKTPSVCPQCGESLSPDMKACTACGSDEQTGWSEEAEDPGFDMSEEEYREAVEHEFGSNGQERKFGKEVLTALVIILVMAGFLLYMFKG